MNAVLHATWLGVARGRQAFLNGLSNPSDLTSIVVINGSLLAMIIFRRDDPVPGLGVSMALVTLPSLIGLLAGFGGITGTALSLAMEREDGTLLRSKAVPHGMVGHLVGAVVLQLLNVALILVLLLVAGLFFVDGMTGIGVGGLLGLVGIVLLGMAATLPWGAIAGSLTKSPASTTGMVMLPFMGLAAISGIFYPISNMPAVLQGIAQVFPLYWLGLGSRAAVLPDAAAAAEIGESWRLLETLGVLGLWAVAGLIIAPRVLRRMARRESGADMEARKRRALARVR
ncbi:MAG: ABC transporter permease [Streptosporangiales bacterium]|nr:ABC transporter permease [Streptosporangiales bacterium]